MPLPDYPYISDKPCTKAEILETLQKWITVTQLKPDEKISDTEIAGNEYIDEFCSALWVRIARLDYLFFRDNSMESSYNDHCAMISSFRIKDPFGASIAMKNNWNYSMLAVKAAAAEAGDIV